MLGRTHLAIGAVLALWILPYLKPANTLLFLAVAIPCSLLPDIDHPNSTINRRLIVTKPLSWLFRHRGFLHSAWPLAGGSLALMTFAGPTYALGFGVGYTSHLVGDAMTKDGVNLLHPFGKFRVQGPFKTGTLAESILFVGLLGVIFLQVWLFI